MTRSIGVDRSHVSLFRGVSSKNISLIISFDRVQTGGDKSEKYRRQAGSAGVAVESNALQITGQYNGGKKIIQEGESGPYEIGHIGMLKLCRERC